jgi:hypothetical protein
MAASAAIRSAGSQSASASAGSAQSSMRGTKRGNRGARTTVSAQQAFADAPYPVQAGQGGRAAHAASAGHGQTSGQAHQSPTTPRAAIDLPTRLPYLERSPSLVSVTSDNDRPRKRVHGPTPSPLSPLGPGASGIPGAHREAGPTGGKLRKEQPGMSSPTQYISGLPTPRGGMPSMGSAMATQSVAAVHAAASPQSAHEEVRGVNANRRPASRIPTSAPLTSTTSSAPASTRRHASPLRESTAQAAAGSTVSAKYAHVNDKDKERTPTPVSASGSTWTQGTQGAPGSRIPRMGMAPGSPLMRALKGYQGDRADRADRADKGDKGDRAARGSRLAPQYGVTGAGVSGIPSAPTSASASAPAASRRQGMMGAMGALSPPRLGAMWSGLGRTQGELTQVLSR